MQNKRSELRGYTNKRLFFFVEIESTKALLPSLIIEKK